ncbi:Putative metabolite transport protein YwtG [Galdieria sulphuraria]|uniref:MFS transporter, SP family, sugar:H+ symporter n=2 Tax=Galdieria sulphuraria TaxID=130081 RepID=M2W9G3_GALSU|nr:MFS transporter, SP family, sugar:H+ symporter [Galdieria sulphuraria]EME32526.1 MFS transporter, SP family, sugar:H+ symporter [Galdieria sulphuraria]GJD08078.1 Putative metabolite transport protein YwtG [Galdieria sulphuraria]|eukprot:XP_005709046.1 MFS transporter, SP family, sugar:H+ symporter [Galdieria sulphuraria]
MEKQAEEEVLTTHDLEDCPKHSDSLTVRKEESQKQQIDESGTWLLHWFQFFAAFGAMMMGLDQSVIGTASIYAEPDLNISASLWSWISAGASLGATLGSVTAIPFSDLLGRKKALLTCTILYFVGTCMQTFGKEYAVLVVGRLIMGVGMGQESMIMNIYIAEVAPWRTRGGNLNSYNAFQMAGGFIANIWLSITIQVDTMWRWRLFLGSGFVVAFIQFVGVVMFAESPRWHMKNNRNEEAKKVWIRYHGDGPDSLRDFEYARQLVEEELDERKKFQRGFFGDIKEIISNPRIRAPFVTGAMLGFTSQFSGGTAIAYYMTPILVGIGVTAKKAVYAQIPLGFWSLASSIPAFYALDKFGRRFCYLILSLPFVILGIVFGMIGFSLNTASSRAGLFLVGWALINGNGNIGINPVQWVMCGEMYELPVRSYGAAWSAFWIFISAFTTTKTFTKTTDAIGHIGTFGLYLAFTCFFYFWDFLTLPETKNKTLEEVREQFDGGIVGLMKRNSRNLTTYLKSKLQKKQVNQHNMED